MDELDELRLRIAKAKGFVEVGIGLDGIREYKKDDQSYYFQSPFACDKDIPDWPHDIAVAWELVEEMADSGDLFIEHWSDCEWFIANHPLGIHPRQLGVCDGKETGKRDICLAICRAWIAWKENNG